jgi:D-alanyl-D-alanine dipeptidase
VANKLLCVQSALRKIHKEYSLKILYGYRHPDVQKKYFNEIRETLKDQYKDLTEEQFNSIVHNYIAIPDVAGHPTGGAVDLTLTGPDGDLDMGSDTEDYSDQEKMQTFSKTISQEAQKNRMLLHDCMRAEGFAPFYGEWWHFSYGDKEWAYFYNVGKSLYSEKNFSIE